MAKTENLDRFMAKMAKLPHAAKERMSKAAYDNAEEFLGAVQRDIPREHGDLAETLKNEETATGYQVSEGGPSAPYPLHLDVGHKAKGGTHVPARPHWNVNRRALRKRFASRNASAAHKAALDITGGEGF